jgi:hypothetical protein
MAQLYFCLPIKGRAKPIELKFVLEFDLNIVQEVWFIN